MEKVKGENCNKIMSVRQDEEQTYFLFWILNPGPFHTPHAEIAEGR